MNNPAFKLRFNCILIAILVALHTIHLPVTVAHYIVNKIHLDLNGYITFVFAQ